MERLLTSLRAAAEPTRLRLLALAGRGAFCVSEFTEILGQSQPRLSRHLKLLCDCGLLERVREGANVWFTLPHGEPGALARDLVARLPDDDPMLDADRRQAARVLAERARVASESFRRQGADWDEMRALDLPAAAVEAALLDLVPEHRRRPAAGHRHRHGTGAGAAGAADQPRRRGRCLQGHAGAGARAPGTSRPGPLFGAARGHVSPAVCRMRRSIWPSCRWCCTTPKTRLACWPRLARVLRPGGRLIVIDLAQHERDDLLTRLAHRWPGFSDETMHGLLAGIGMQPAAPVTIDGPLTMRSGPRGRRTGASDSTPRELVV